MMMMIIPILSLVTSDDVDDNDIENGNTEMLKREKKRM